MTDYGAVIKFRYPAARSLAEPGTNFVVAHRPQGGWEILLWELEAPQPTIEELEAYAASAEFAAWALDQAKIEALARLNRWRGVRRKALGLTDAWGQELVYTGKYFGALRWKDRQGSGGAEEQGSFPFAGEAAARGLSHLEMAALIIQQGGAWLLGSDAIEGAYVRAAAAVEAAGSEAEVGEVLEELG